MNLSNLGLSNINKFTYDSINESIRKFYNINGNISTFNPYFRLFSNYEKNYLFNHKHKLIRLIKKKGRIDTTGYRFKALIKYKNITYFKNVFIKEVPLFSLDMVNSYDTNSNSIDLIQQSINNKIYNLNSSCNVEIFTSYLVNKLSEAKLSPSFGTYYGSYLTNFKKFTYEENDLNTEKYSQFKKYVKNDTTMVEVNDIPVQMLVIEQLEFDFQFAYETNMINYFFLISIIFQIISAIIVLQREFNLKHNDLHIGNIMFIKTHRKYLYYKSESVYFKVPTFGFLVKIIDWGRSTFRIKDIDISNNIFSFEGECFHQYRHRRLGCEKKCILPSDNKWSDLVIISHNILHNCKEYIDSDIGIFLKKIIKTNSNKIDIDTFDWSVYLNISKNVFNINPKSLLRNKLFKDYQINKDEIMNQSVYVYNISY